MQIKIIKTLTPSQKYDLCELWNNEYPAQLGYADMAAFDAYLAKLIEPVHFLVEDENGKIIGWYFHFFRDNGKWFVIILSSDIQGKGVGSVLLKKAKAKETELNGWVTDHNNYEKKNGEVYRSPIGFYKKNGFEVVKEERLELEVLSAVRIRWRKY